MRELPVCLHEGDGNKDLKMADPEQPETNSGFEIDKIAAWLEQIVREPVPDAILLLTAKLQNEIDARSAGQGREGKIVK